MPIVPAPEPAVVNVTTENPADEAVQFDVTIAVANTSQPLFTVPVGKRLRGFSLENVSTVNVRVSLTPDAPATTAHTLLEKKGDTWSESGLDLPEGDYEFIGPAGARVTGVALVGPA